MGDEDGSFKVVTVVFGKNSSTLHCKEEVNIHCVCRFFEGLTN